MIEQLIKFKCACGNDKFVLVAEKNESDYSSYSGATVYLLCSSCLKIPIRTGLDGKYFPESNFESRIFVPNVTITPDDDLKGAAIR